MGKSHWDCAQTMLMSGLTKVSFHKTDMPEEG